VTSVVLETSPVFSVEVTMKSFKTFDTRLRSSYWVGALSPGIEVVTCKIWPNHLELKFTILASHGLTERTQAREVRSIRVHGIPLSPLVLSQVSTGGLSEKKLPWQFVLYLVFETSSVSNEKFDYLFTNSSCTWNSSFPFYSRSNSVVPISIDGSSVK
jgi:hypothetical protein